MRDKKVLFITQAAMIAALYVVLTLLANALGLANYAVQIRFSEALTILPFFTPAAIPGLWAGCVLANILTGCAPLDILFGSLATLVGAFLLMYFAGISGLRPCRPLLQIRLSSHLFWHTYISFQALFPTLCLQWVRESLFPAEYWAWHCLQY